VFLPQAGVRAGTGQVHGAAGFVAGEVKPHRLERYMASNHPQFEEKAADIIVAVLFFNLRTILR
jgi:hypothetical protein